MIRSLRIRDLAIAKDVCIEPDEGFSVLTGETGAGKSILLDGLSLVLGERISKDLISPGKDCALVSVIFGGISRSENAKYILDDLGIEADSEDEIEIVRRFGADGKTSARINGIVVSLTSLREIGERLVSISSQADNRTVGNKNAYSDILDIYCDLSDELSVYRKDHTAYVDAVRERDEIEKALRDKVMMTDIYSYQLKEIDEVRLSDPEEEEKLEKQKTKLKDSERIIKYASMVRRALSQNDKGATASYLVDRAKYAVDNLADVIGNAGELSVRLENIRYELEDIAERVYDVVDPDLENPDAKLDKIETRLDKIAKLRKKYGASIADVLEYRRSIAEKLEALESGDLALKEADSKVDRAYEKALVSAGIVSDKRKLGAERLSETVADILRYLDIPKAIFQIKISPRYSEDGKLSLSSDGYDEVAFMFTANSGYPMQELYKVASGGELSRTMLALKCALSERQDVPTVVFDEIDTGVSGATSERIGLKLKELSRRMQVICVTHSPQVAALADAHFLIKKVDSGNGAESVVRRLDEDERVSEIARIIGGVKVTEKQIQAAKEMIEKNRS